jgi:hypothetical protein
VAASIPSIESLGTGSKRGSDIHRLARMIRIVMFVTSVVTCREDDASTGWTGRSRVQEKEENEVPSVIEGARH